ncbi:MAG: flagellar protein FlaG [Caulobacteraceae bacterium]|nr:flagellar protein FlaG [Caulobacteraceae bacterium]
MSINAPIPSIPEAAATSPAQNPPQSQLTPPNATAASAAAQAATEQLSADLRLVIEEDKAAGSYVYRTVDPRTGKVVSQIPREQLLRMREAATYLPGSVINTRG